MSFKNKKLLLACVSALMVTSAVSVDAQDNKPFLIRGESPQGVVISASDSPLNKALNPADSVAVASEPLETLEGVLAYSYHNNPTLQAARAELFSVQENLPQAQAGWKPTIGADANVQKSWIDGSNFGGDGTVSKTIGAEITQPLFRGGRTVAATDEARQQIAAQRALLLSLEQDVMLGVATAYVDVVRDEAVVKLQDKTRSVIARELEASRDRFELGEITLTDVSQAEARLARAEADRISALGALKISRARYNSLVGHYPGNLGRPVLNFGFADDLDTLISEGEEYNPSVLAAKYLHESAEFNVDETFGELLPTIQAFGNWQRDYDPQPGLLDQSETSSIGISASIPLYQAGSVRSRIRQAKHTANQRYIEILESRRDVREQVSIAWQNLKSAEAEIESRKAQVKAAAVAQEGVREEAFLGARTVLDTLDADQELLDAETALLSAERDEVVAQFELASALGMLKPKNLGFGDFNAQFEEHLEEIQAAILGFGVDID